MHTHDAGAVGRRAGNVFALGTVGSLSGALACAFWLLPMTGLRALWISIALILSTLSAGWLVLSLLRREIRGAKCSTIFYGSMLAMAMLGAAPFIVAPDTADRTFTTRILTHEQSRYADLKIIDIAGYTCLAMDGNLQSCRWTQTGQSTYTYLADMGRAVQTQWERSGRRADFRALVLGVGAGDIFKFLPAAIAVDAVELDPDILRLAKSHFDLSGSSSMRFFSDDARHFLRTGPDTYDVILVDLCLGAGVPEHMYSREGFELLKSRVSAGGSVIMNMNSRFDETNPLPASIVRTAEAVFPEVALFAAFPERPEEFQSALMVASDLEYDVTFSTYRPLAYHPTAGRVIIDDFNPLAMYGLSDMAEYRQGSRTFAGPSIFFSL
jgi:spermidine synthase